MVREAVRWIDASDGVGGVNMAGEAYIDQVKKFRHVGDYQPAQSYRRLVKRSA